MAKITDLPVATALTGDEHLPIVQGPTTKRATLVAFRNLIVPFLQTWYKGDKGDTGTSSNTYDRIGAMQASDTARATAQLLGDPGTPDGTFDWKVGDFVALATARPADYIASSGTPMDQGAWVRRGAESIRAGTGSVADALNARPTTNQIAAPAGANLIGFDAGADAIQRSVQGKLREIMVSIMDFGAVPNVYDAAAATINRLALARAFAKSNRVYVPGTRADYFLMAANPAIPAGCSLFGDGATLWMQGEGISLGHYSESIGVSYRGIQTPKMRGEAGSGLPSGQVPTVGSVQYALVYIDTKIGCRLHIPFLRDGLINGVQANNSSYCDIQIERAGNFGSDQVFAPTEGSIVYAPALTHSTVRIGHGWGSFGLGAVSLVQPSFVTVEGKITDTRRGGVFSAPNNPVGFGNRVRGMTFQRMGGITPIIANPPSNHWQATFAIFWPGAGSPGMVDVTDPVVEDWGETLLEGTMRVTNLNARITRTAGKYYDEDMLSPNPGALYGTMDIAGAVIDGYRGRGFNAGGEPGHGIYDVQLRGMLFANPRPTHEYGRPEFVRIQPLGGTLANPDDGTANIADNVVIDSCVGFDTTGYVERGFVLSGAKGGGFTPNCIVKGCDSRPAAVTIDPAIRQRSNGWLRQAYTENPTLESLRDALVGAGIMAGA